MSTLDDLKKKWRDDQSASQAADAVDAATLNQLIQRRMKKQNNLIFRYFWATFTLHILVYALLSHVLIRYGADTDILLLSLSGFLVTVPFTAVMLKRYKQMAVTKASQGGKDTIYTYVNGQRSRVAAFYTFKKRYEIVLIPLLSAIGVILVFTLYFPGGVLAFPTGAVVTYLLTLLSCFFAIRNENKKYFIRPLQELQAILDDYKS
ncbi:hypothetical protein I2I11_20995 [Pontibacter sp. 172403-2]|uniref:hypothetical protein n=1 Tax=Pontibacter rufus TaxID=2791028 RepID=UPI0018AFFE17|nr:hypothetical protein [Pontibacter sp. 172403-2]MBF9255789.1 hypothetical protein [Pontibacter sp. 172403-2]